MRDKLIKLLGGVTANELKLAKDELKLVHIERDSYKSSTDSLKGQLMQAEKYFEFRNNEGDAFKEIVMNQMGLRNGAANLGVPKDNDLRPIQTKTMTARELMREMEIDDKKRAAAQQREERENLPQ